MGRILLFISSLGSLLVLTLIYALLASQGGGSASASATPQASAPAPAGKMPHIIAMPPFTCTVSPVR